MKMSAFSAPFSGARKSEGFCFQSDGVRAESGKAEAAKLPDAGISPKQSYIRECQEKHLPLGSVPRYFSRHSAQLIGRAPTVCEWSSSGVLFVSSREAARHFFSPVVPFHGCDSAIRFLKRTSLTVIHWMSGNAWSYLRLVVYGFLGLSEGA
jgi:hypothetical protein